MTALYIHVPWCIKKCPYCDFNSHQQTAELPEIQYVDALINDLDHDLSIFPRPTLSSIFIGGGTPSLFSAGAYARLFDAIAQRMAWPAELEITLEANPGSVEQQRFYDYRAIGINRLSLGIQSFNPAHLKSLARVHDDKSAHLAIKAARRAKFDRINLDLMYALPEQSVQQGLDDLKTAISYQPEHLSWYQLTIEPNTVFYKQRPSLPAEDVMHDLEDAGLSLLDQNNYQRYEISAFCRNNQVSKHNLNYWMFGDYYGIGAGAHGKLTCTNTHVVYRTQKQRQPRDYLNSHKSHGNVPVAVSAKDLVFEFMLNTSRLEQWIPLDLFAKTTGLGLEALMPGLVKAESLGMIQRNATHWQVLPFGRRFTNDLQALFL